MAEDAKTFSIRVPQDLLDRIAALAEKEDRSQNAQILHLIKRGLRAIERQPDQLEVMQQLVERISDAEQSIKEVAEVVIENVHTDAK